MSVAAEDAQRLTALCASQGVALQRLGVVAGDRLDLGGPIVTIAELRDAHEATIPALFG